MKKAIKAELTNQMDAEAMAQAALEGLKAEKVYFQNGQEIKTADHATRLKYLEFIRDTVEGTPVKRQEIIHGTAPNPEGLRKKLEGSPAMRASLKRVLDSVEAKASQKGVALDAPEDADFVDLP